MQNKRKKFDKTVVIPNDNTLQGETRDPNRAVKRMKTGKNNTRILLNLHQEGQGKKIVNEDNREEHIDRVHDKNSNQDIDYNSIHKPPDLNPAPADTRDEYDEVFHDVKFMETKEEMINRGEERMAQSDDKLTRVNINSEYQEMDLHRRNTSSTKHLLLQQFFTDKLPKSGRGFYSRVQDDRREQG